MGTRIYQVKDEVSKEVCLVEAVSKAQALSLVAGQRYSVDVASALTVASMMAQGHKLLQQPQSIAPEGQEGQVQETPPPQPQPPSPVQAAPAKAGNLKFGGVSI